MIQALEAVLGVGGIAGDKVEMLEFQGDQPPLPVQRFVPEPVGNGQGRLLREDGGAGVALLLGAAPELLVTRRIHHQLPRLHFCLLQAEAIGVGAAEEIIEALLHAGAQAVDVPGNQFHADASHTITISKNIVTKNNIDCKRPEPEITKNTPGKTEKNKA